MATYKAVLFAPDGDWTTDYAAPTISEVWENIGNGGSRWYFYPFPAVIRDNGRLTRPTQRIVDAPEPFQHMIGRPIGNYARMLAAMPEPAMRAILEG